VEEDRVELSLHDSLNDYLFACRDRTTKAFDHENPALLAEAIASIGRILSLKVIMLAKGAHLLGLRFDVFALLRTALDTLVSALHLARQRAHIEVACLVRSSLESACTALHISKDAKAYESFLRQTYHSTKSIHAAKKEIPLVGEIWGALSQVAVHVNRQGHGPKFERGESRGEWVGTVDLDFQARAAEPDRDRMSLVLISLAAEIVARSQELSLLDEDSAHPGWRRLPGTSTILYSATNARIDERHRQFLSLADAKRNA
jgi:hypothetical protein